MSIWDKMYKWWENGLRGALGEHAAAGAVMKECASSSSTAGRHRACQQNGAHRR